LAIRSIRRGEPPQDRQRCDELLAGGLSYRVGPQLLGDVRARQRPRLGDELEPGSELLQRALDRAERPEHGRQLGRDRQAVVGDDAEQVAEHAHARLGRGVVVPGQEPTEIAFESLLVDDLRTGDELEKGVTGTQRVTPVHGEQESLQRFAQAGSHDHRHDPVSQDDAARRGDHPALKPGADRVCPVGSWDDDEDDGDRPERGDGAGGHQDLSRIRCFRGITELAGRVQLTVSPCHRRLRQLERSGAIRGYHAVVDPAALGLAFEALVFVTMRHEDRETLLSFEQAVAEIPNVLLAQQLFGDPDYLLRIVTADLTAYQQLEDDVLSALPGVQRLNSTLVMKRVVDDRPFPA
jgi:DNA-binding Lrp family transcriptional regulator